MTDSISPDDRKYPKALKEALKVFTVSMGPKKLYYKGAFDDDIFKNCLAVVGSRHLTSYGRRMTEQIVGEVAAAGITIVSGFMYGGDEAAHSAAVNAGARTIAVMPCGINVIHPPNQKELYQKILDNNGLIISEYEEDFMPQTWSYVQRDRIVAGLSKAIFVTEAALNSGSLVTAKYASKYGRKIFALPGQITSELSKGTLKLIKEGAEIVTEARDILTFFNILVSQKRQPAFAKASAGKCSTLEQEIISQLKREPMEADLIARNLGMPAAKIGTELSLMQLKGFINQDSGKYYIN
jgi:DNA processing protein